uniref:Histone H3 n=1 Tax=Calidris pygmaea TaxID=425635 RepID=A0A8C3J0B6_9CHAR
MGRGGEGGGLRCRRPRRGTRSPHSGPPLRPRRPSPAAQVLTPVRTRGWGGAPSLWEKLRLSRKKAPKLLPEASLAGLVRGLSPLRGGLGVRGAALAALREGCEAQLLALLEEWGLCALHAKRAAPRAADIRLVRCLRVKRG